MGLLDHLIGNVSEVEPSDVQNDIEPLLIQNENVEAAFAVMRDLLLFTNLRLIWIDKQGVTGKKVKFDSIPYKSIYRFTLETAGTFDAEADLKLWVRGQREPMNIQLSRKIDTGKVGRVLAQYAV